MATKNKLTVTQYRKGFRESCMIVGTNRPSKSSQLRKKRDEYLQSQIQLQKDQYIAMVEEKVKEVGVDRPLKDAKKKRLNKSVAYSPSKQREMSEAPQTNRSPLPDVKQFRLSIDECTNDVPVVLLQPKPRKQRYGHIGAAMTKQFSKPENGNTGRLSESEKAVKAAAAKTNSCNKTSIATPASESASVNNSAVFLTTAATPSSITRKALNLSMIGPGKTLQNPFEKYPNIRKIKELMQKISSSGRDLQRKVFRMHQHVKKLRHSKAPV